MCLELGGLGGVGAVRELEEDFVSGLWLEVSVVDVAVSADSSGEVHILLEDSGALGVDGAEVGVLEDSDDVSFRSFLEGKESLRLESEFVIEIRADASDKSLERGAWKEVADRFLIFLNLSEGDGTWLVSSCLLLLDSSGGWS